MKKIDKKLIYKITIIFLIIYMGLLLTCINLLANKIQNINNRIDKLEVNYSIYEYDINQLREYRGK
jgi:hypothetical protein